MSLAIAVLNWAMNQRYSLGWLSLAIAMSCLPAAAQEATLPTSIECRPMSGAAIYGITAIVLIGILAALAQIDRRLRREGWSLANALSEPSKLQVPIESSYWLDSMGDKQSDQATRVRASGSQSPQYLTVLEPSSSRLIALVGMVAILMMFIGFGIFSLFTFGFTCTVPTTIGAATGFLYSGLTLFAPYVANKFSKVLQPLSRQSEAQEAVRMLPKHVAKPAPRPTASITPVAQAAQKYHEPSSSRITYKSHQDSSNRTPSHHQRQNITYSNPKLTTGTATSSAGTTAAASATSQWQPAIAMISQFEGFVDHAYPDPASGAEPWTIGYGFTRVAGLAVEPGQTITREEADQELCTQVRACAAHLSTTIPYWQEMNDNQRCALIDFAWNLGEDFYGDESDFASITRDLRNRNWSQVPQTLCLYCDPGTTVSEGLLRRRRAEGSLWNEGLSQSSQSSLSDPHGDSIRVAQSHPNPLDVPYFDQLMMTDGQGYRECFSASSAMLAAYWGKEANENSYDKLRERYGDTTSAEAQLDALRSLGLQADFRTDGTESMIKAEIDAGRPVAVGWLCDGPVSAPSGGGHWSVIIGYDTSGFLINDPYGNCDLVEGGYASHHDGAGLHYSYRNWVPRWRPEGSGGWMLTCRI